ncbi:hypothetical protein HCR16_00970 [Wolbachia pipientis]|nr:hypothetical protein [Wolbachia pipientis]
MYSLSLRPGNSPLSYDNVVGRLQHFGFPPCCYPSYRIPTFILVGLSPTEQYSPSLDPLGYLKNRLEIAHTRHRSPVNFLVHIFSTLISYSIKSKKPSISYTFFLP